MRRSGAHRELLLVHLAAAVLATAVGLGSLAGTVDIGHDPVTALHQARLQAARAALRQGGRPALDNLASQWPQAARERVVEEALRGLADRPSEALTGGVGAPILWLLSASLALCLAYCLFLLDRSRRWTLAMRTACLHLEDGAKSLCAGALAELRKSVGAPWADEFARKARQIAQAREQQAFEVQHLAQGLLAPLARIERAAVLAESDPDRRMEGRLRLDRERRLLTRTAGELAKVGVAGRPSSRADAWFDVARLLEEICEDVRFEFEARRVDLQLLFRGGLLGRSAGAVLMGQREMLRVAIETIVRNAVRFTPDDKGVMVRGVMRGRLLVIEVWDEGPGLTLEMLRRFDEPAAFTTPELSPDRGLSIARRSLAAHGGFLEAINIGCSGALIRICLPLHAAPKR